VNLLRIEDALANHFHLPVLDCPEEASAVPFMTGGAADLVHFEQNRVGVAVDEDLAHFLHMAALLALAPQASAAAAVVTGPAAAQRFFVSFPVHPGEHEHLARAPAFTNHRDDPAPFTPTHPV